MEHFPHDNAHLVAVLRIPITAEDIGTLMIDRILVLIRTDSTTLSGTYVFHGTGSTVNVNERFLFK